MCNYNVILSIYINCVAFFVVKIISAHNNNDFEVGNRHDLERVKVINSDGTMNELCGQFNGMDRFVCCRELVNLSLTIIFDNSKNEASMLEVLKKEKEQLEIINQKLNA